MRRSNGYNTGNNPTTNDKQPTPKRNDWTRESVYQAAYNQAKRDGANHMAADAYARSTVHTWAQGNPTPVTHNYN